MCLPREYGVMDDIIIIIYVCMVDGVGRVLGTIFVLF